MQASSVRSTQLAGSLLVGLIAASAAPRPAPILALVGLALAVAGRHGLAAALALGLVAGWWWPPPAPPAIGAPVTLSGLLERPWRAVEEGWLGSLRVRHYRQGRRVELWNERVALLVPGAEPPAVGRELRVRGLLRRAPGLANRAPLPPGPWRLRLKSRRFLETRSRGWPDAGWRLGLTARRRIEGAMSRAGEGPGVLLAGALVLGDSARLPRRWLRGLRAAGLAHLVALSGLHVGLLAGCFLAAGAALRRGIGPGLAVAAALGFLLLAGPRPALIRATTMGVLAAGALALGRRPHGLTLLAMLAALLALLEPRLLADLGFRLTCAATAGILWLSPRFAAAWTLLPGFLCRPLAVTAGAQIASLPWALPAFNLWTPPAPLWNLVAVPWTALALAVCLIWVVVALIWPAAAALAAPLLDVAAWPFAAVAALPPRVTGPRPVLLDGWAAGLAMAGIAFVLLRPGRRWPWAALALAALALAGARAPALELRLLDVGQGEAVLLRDGETAVLVDGGGWRQGDIGGRVLVPALAAAGVHRLDALVLSHPDIDHCGGLVDLLSYLPVGEIWTAAGWRPRPCAAELLSAPGPRLRLLWSGEAATAGRWRFLALHPDPGDRGPGNNRSLVLAAQAPGLRALLTGDIEAAAERRLLRRWPEALLRSDLLKVPHHGSASSTTSGLLAAVRPRLALISCGRGNPYGHPAPEVLRRLTATGARVLRTDLSGEIGVRHVAGSRWRMELPGTPHPD